MRKWSHYFFSSNVEYIYTVFLYTHVWMWQFCARDISLLTSFKGFGGKKQESKRQNMKTKEGNKKKMNGWMSRMLWTNEWLLNQREQILHLCTRSRFVAASNSPENCSQGLGAMRYSNAYNAIGFWKRYTELTLSIFNMLKFHGKIELTVCPVRKRTRTNS